MLLSKYEANQETGELEFEKGNERFDVDGSIVTFSDLVTKEDDPNEILAFSWDSSPFHVKTVKVKAGNECLSVDPDASETGGRVDLRELIDEDPIPAVSHVSFCKIVYYQVDFVEEDAPFTPPRYGGEGLISALTGDSENGVVDLRSFPEHTLVDDGDWKISVSSDGTTASVDFEVIEQPSEDLLLASYEMPGPLTDKSEIDIQILVDYETGSFDEGDTGSLEVALPQVE